MNSYLASPLHLVATILNLPLFHEGIYNPPPNLTQQGVHLLATLAKDEAFARQANLETIQFLSESVADLTDIKYTQATQYFVRLLASVIGQQDSIWGAISYIMAGVVNDFEHEYEQECWRRLCGFLFFVLTEEGIAQVDQGDIPTVRPKPKDDRPSIEQYSVPQPNVPILPSVLSTPAELVEKAAHLLNEGPNQSFVPSSPSTNDPSTQKKTETRRGIQIKNRY